MKWFKYAECRPKKGGLYLWRMTSQINGLKVVCREKMRSRLVGLGSELSPAFDYWDGYKLIVPDDLEWAEDNCDFPDVLFESLPKLNKCGFCKAVPKLTARQYANGFGLVLPPQPHYFNRFSLECCASLSVSSDSVVRLVKKWNEAFKLQC